MPRTPRVAPADTIFHVLNRANGRRQIFSTVEDYNAFERVMADAYSQVRMRILSYCVMPNHWHMVLWPLKDGDLSEFMQWLTTTHVRRWHLQHGTVGQGHLYQGPYKSFPLEESSGSPIVNRYVERNAKTANLVERAEEWRWCSLWRRLHPEVHLDKPPLCEWPVERSDDWVELVNEPLTPKEWQALKISLDRGRPLGGAAWQRETAKRLGLERTLKIPGRPRKKNRER